MPIYQFINHSLGPIPIIHDVIMSMNDVHEYNGPNGDQKGQWKRLWSSPEASVDTRVDPYSAKDFVKVTNKKGVVGDLWERSAELSEARASREGGVDPVKQGFYNRFSSKRGGKKHPQQVREEGARALKDRGIHLDWGDR